MDVDLNLLERWLTGWSLARGLPLPRREDEGLVVDVGWPDQLRRHVFVDAGLALRECAARIHVPFVHVKAAVDNDRLRLALPDRWAFESQRYLMSRPAAMALPGYTPAGYVAKIDKEHGAVVLRYVDEAGQTAASGRLVLHGRCAVFDRIETEEPHRGRGLGRAVMIALDALAEQAGVGEGLLVASEAGRGLYLKLGWRELSAYATAVSPAV